MDFDPVTYSYDSLKKEDSNDNTEGNNSSEFLNSINETTAEERPQSSELLEGETKDVVNNIGLLEEQLSNIGESDLDSVLQKIIHQHFIGKPNSKSINAGLDGILKVRKTIVEKVIKQRNKCLY